MPPKRGKKTPAGAGAGAKPGGPGPGASASAAGTPSAAPAHIQTTGVKRPGYGKAGRATTVLVNHFTCTIPTGTIYHYDGRCLTTRLKLAHLCLLMHSFAINYGC